MDYIQPAVIIGFFTLLFFGYAHFTEQRFAAQDDRLKDHAERLQKCESARGELATQLIAVEREKVALQAQLMETVIKLATALSPHHERELS